MTAALWDVHGVAGFLYYTTMTMAARIFIM